MVYGQNTAHQVWSLLANKFAPNSRTRISQLKRQLQTLNQGSQNISDWKMLKAQLKSNFGPTFLLSLKKKTNVEERKSLQLERE